MKALLGHHPWAAHDEHFVAVTHALRSEGAGASEDGTGRGTPLVTVAEPLDASYAKTTDSAGSNGAGPRNVVIGYDQHNGLMTGDVSPTMTSGADRGNRGSAVAVSANQRGEVRERPIHGSLNGSKSGKQYDGVMAGLSVRRLTPVECERLQGFPDGWTDGLSDSARYRCLGNAVCVPVMEWIGRRLMEQAA